jgi:hypothetical protein
MMSAIKSNHRSSAGCRSGASAPCVRAATRGSRPGAVSGGASHTSMGAPTEVVRGSRGPPSEPIRREEVPRRSLTADPASVCWLEPTDRNRTLPMPAVAAPTGSRVAPVTPTHRGGPCRLGLYLDRAPADHRRMVVEPACAEHVTLGGGWLLRLIGGSTAGGLDVASCVSRAGLAQPHRPYR